MVRREGTKLVIEIDAHTEVGVAGELEALHKALTGILMSLDENMLYKEEIYAVSNLIQELCPDEAMLKKALA